MLNDKVGATPTLPTKFNLNKEIQMVVIEKVYVACDECSARGKRYSVEIPASAYDLQNIAEHLRKRLPKWRIDSHFGNLNATICPTCKPTYTGE